MTGDIFKLFKNSIEQLEIRDSSRGSLNVEDPSIDLKLDAIVKRRKSMTTTAEGGEDYQNTTTIHFRPCNYQYVKVGYYVNVDDEWHSILTVKSGKDFNSGKLSFLYVTIDSDITNDDGDPDWTTS